jgi:hypothetical protein
LIVATPSGNVTVLVRAQIPAGFALSETFLTQEPCFVPGYGLGSGRLVATPAGVSWFRGAHARREARLEAGGIQKDVGLLETDEGIDAVDAD